MEFVLDGGKELLRQGCLRAVIGREGVDVGDLLINAALAGADFPYALEQFVEIVLAEGVFALLEPLVVHDESLDDELAQGFGGPDAELGGLVAVDPVADSDDGVEVVVFGGVFLPVRGSMFQNGTY
jgi:hypothetical protein